MKKTIKEDLERIVIKEKLLDNNSLIQYECNRDDKTVSLVVRYIKNNTIKEDIITTMTLDEYINELDNIVKINKNDSAIAIFKKETYNNVFNEYTLRDCYDLKDHSFAIIDFLDIEYNEKFPNNKVDKYLVVKKKK